MRAAFLALALILIAKGGPVMADEPRALLRFWDADDVEDARGRVEFGAHPLQALGTAEGFVGRDVGCVLPRAEGGLWVYTWTCHDEEGRFAETNPLRVFRSWTEDGRAFHDAERVFSDASQRWLSNVNIVRRGTDGALMIFSWARGKPGHALYVFESADGRDWRPVASPAFTDHDAFSVVWDARAGRFVDFQTTYQNWRKKYPDNLGAGRRRVLSLRTSADGVTWEPAEDVGFNGPYRPAADLTVPDGADPEELEFYRVCAFPHEGRFAALLCLYAPSPQVANTRKGTRHGPGLGAEWMFWRDATEPPSRPARDVDAVAESGGWIPIGSPVPIGGVLNWYNGLDGAIAGIRADRIFFAFCRANGEFSTPLFIAPEAELTLNASAARHDSYVMVEVRDEDGKVIPGYERDHCVMTGVDDARLPLRWNDASTAALAGRRIRLRTYFRDARIYSLSERIPE